MKKKSDPDLLRQHVCFKNHHLQPQEEVAYFKVLVLYFQYICRNRFVDACTCTPWRER